MTKLNISNETIKLAKAIKIADSSTPIDFVVYGENEESEILIEKWDKLNEEQLKNVFFLIDWREVFNVEEDRTFSEEAISRFLNIALPYAERYMKEKQQFKSSSNEYRVYWYLYDCLCTQTIPRNYWDRILKLSKTMVSTFYGCQPFDESDIESLINKGFKVDMDKIVKFHELSESFMEKYEKSLNWDLISKFQYFSEDFLMKHLDKLNLDVIEERVDF